MSSVSSVSLLAEAVTHAHGRFVAHRRSRPGEPLPVPVISVGNIAFGGRAKTPLVAALAQAAQEDGLRPAVITRGYRRRGRGTALAVGAPGDVAPWLGSIDIDGVWRTLPEAVGVLGDEAAWLAATLRGVPVAVDADRPAAARALLAHHRVDVILLDDGFQHPMPRDVDVVVIRPGDGAGGRPCREPAASLARADHLLVLDPAGDLRRRPGRLRTLGDGSDAAIPRGVRVLCGVADAGSVARVAELAGLTVISMHDLGDHRGPGRRRRRSLAPSQEVPWLLTEKDAVGWAAARPPPGPALVLGLELDGVAALWSQIRADLRAAIRD